MKAELLTIKKAIDGDMDAFQKLYDTYFSQVLMYISKRVNSISICEDISQEVFLKVYMNIGKLKDYRAFKGWLFKICGNEIKGYYSNRDRGERLEMALKETEVLKEEVRINETEEKIVVSEKAQQATLTSMIDQLSDILKEVVILKYYCGLSLRKISILLDIPEKLVKSRLHECRKKLKKLLDRDNVIEDNSIQDIFQSSIYDRRREALMEKVKVMEMGSYIIPRMSIEGQRELYYGAKDNKPFSERVIQELSKIKSGKEFIEYTEGSIASEELNYILCCCDNNTVSRLHEELMEKSEMVDLKKELHRYQGTQYNIDKVEVTFFVPSIEDTVKWYQEILGWEGDLVCMDDKGVCGYGCIFKDDLDGLIDGSRIFNGIHLKAGENNEKSSTEVWVHVDNIKVLRERILGAGWEEIGEIQKEPWSAYTMTMRDLNGNRLMFVEWIH